MQWTVNNELMGIEYFRDWDACADAAVRDWALQWPMTPCRFEDIADRPGMERLNCGTWAAKEPPRPCGIRSAPKRPCARKAEGGRGEDEAARDRSLRPRSLGHKSLGTVLQITPAAGRRVGLPRIT